LYSQDRTESTIETSFDSKKAIERSDELVKEYLIGYFRNVSRLVGRVWLDFSKEISMSERTVYVDYKSELEKDSLKMRRMDCTIYAEDCLKAGFDEDGFRRLKKLHNEIYRGKGFAGWSISYLLTEFFGWKAYAFIKPGAKDYQHYLNHFKNDKEYPVWRQPDTKIEEYYFLGEDNDNIEQLLSENEFGWGFSEDGIHTWITNFEDLKECHWDGPPAEKYNPDKSYPLLFETTRFIEFEDYDVHLVVFPNNKHEKDE